MTQKEFEERTGLGIKADHYSEIERKTVLVRELYEERKRLSNFLIAQAEKWSANDLREKAISMIGEKEYLRRKIAAGYNLWDADKELLDIILKN